MKKTEYILISIIIFLVIVLCGTICYFTHKSEVVNEDTDDFVIENQYDGIIVEQQYIDFHKKDTKNILFIGNSITWHPICGYWFGKWGMAATSKDKDYVHLLINKLGKIYNINYKVCSNYNWEINNHDRGELLPLLDIPLSTDNDFIIIQLGENVSDISTFYDDFAELIKYIKNKNKKAKIVVIGNFCFNPSTEKENAKIDICKKEKIKYIDVSDIDNQEYYLGEEAEVYGEDNKLHKITHKGVFVHPNDKAMEVYANRIYDYLIK